MEKADNRRESREASIKAGSEPSAGVPSRVFDAVECGSEARGLRVCESICMSQLGCRGAERRATTSVEPHAFLKHSRGRDPSVWSRGTHAMIQALGNYALRWKVHSVQSVNRQILLATLTVASLTFLVHVTTAVKELLIAYRFGIGDELDAFLLAVLLPTLAVVVLAGSFASAAMPIYLEVERREGREASYRLYGNLLAASVAILIAVTLLLMLLFVPIIALLDIGFSAENIALTRSLFFVMLPVVVIKGVCMVWGAVLNAGSRFWLAAAVPVCTPLLTVVILLELGGSWGVYTLALGMVGGALAEASALAWYLKRLGIPFLPRWTGWTPALSQVMRQYRAAVVGAVLMSSTALVDQAMAGMLGPGNISALTYGGKVFSLLVVVGATGLGTAVLPYFSRMVEARDWSGVRRTLRTYIRGILWVTVPIMVLTMALSDLLIRVIFERGAFTAVDTETVGRVQMFLMLQLPFYVVGILMVRLISSLKANSILMWGCVINFALNVVLNYVLMQRFGVAGIALSTAIVIVTSTAYLGVRLSHSLRALERGQPIMDGASSGLEAAWKRS